MSRSSSWVVSGYVLTLGGFLLLGPRAGDLLGRSIDGAWPGGLTWTRPA